MKINFKTNVKKMLAGAMISSLVFGTFAGAVEPGEANTNTFNPEQAHYFMNEDFGNYQGGIPAGWSVSGSGLTASNLESNSGAISIGQNNAGLTYVFPESIKTGEFTIEFKVKRAAADTAWWVRMLDEADVLASAEGLETDVNDTVFNKDSNAFIGNSTGLGAENNSKVFINLGRRGWLGYKSDSIEAPGTTEVCGDIAVAESANIFTNIKATVDIDAGTCIIKVDDGQEYTKNFQRDRFRIRRLKTADGQPDIIAYGIRGFEFCKGTGGNVLYDDIKVYTKAYNTNQDFNGFKTNKTNTHFGWWYAGNVNLNNTQTGNYIFDPITDSENNGLKLSGASVDDSVNKNRVAVTPLNIPISAGRKFTIEFDLYLKDTGASSSFNVLTLDKEDLFYTSTNTNNNTEPQNNVGVDATAEKEMLSANIIFNETKGSGIIIADGLYERGSKVKTGAEEDSEDLRIPLSQWHHVKLVVTPEKNIGYVTYNEQTYTAEYPNAKPNTEVAGIGFGCTAKYTMPYIDNLKVYENDEVNTVSVVGVKADGRKIDSNTIDAGTNLVTVELSNAINNADAVELYHKDSIGLKNNVSANKMLSENGKCVTFSNITGLEAGKQLVLALNDNARGKNSSFDNIERYVNYLNVDNLFIPGAPKLQIKSGDTETAIWNDVSSNTIQTSGEYRMYADIYNADKAYDDTNIMYIAALYDGDQLKYVGQSCWKKDTGGNSVSLEIPTDILYTSIRLFAWQGNGYKPIYNDSVFSGSVQ